MPLGGTFGDFCDFWVPTGSQKSSILGEKGIFFEVWKFNDPGRGPGGGQGLISGGFWEDLGTILTRFFDHFSNFFYSRIQFLAKNGLPFWYVGTGNCYFGEKIELLSYNSLNIRIHESLPNYKIFI